MWSLHKCWLLYLLPNFSPDQSQSRETDIYMTCHTNGGVAGGEQYHSVDRRPLFARYTLALSKHPASSTAPINKLQILILIDGVAVRGIEGHGE